jgi:hypothetical protein
MKLSEAKAKVSDMNDNRTYFQLYYAEEEVKMLKMSMMQQQNVIRAAIIALEEDDVEEAIGLLKEIVGGQ